MKNCGNCGAPMNDADIICQNCGARTAPVAKAAPKAGVKMPDLKKIPKKYLGIGAIAVAALVVILLATLLFGSSYKDAIDNYFDVYVGGKYNKIEKLAPKEYWEKISGKNEEKGGMDIDVKDLISTLKEEEAHENWIEELEDEYGKNVKASYKVTDKDEMKKSDFNDLKDYLSEVYDVPKKSIKKAYELELDVTFKGKDDKDTEEMEMIVVQIGNKWYVLYAHSEALSSYNQIMAEEAAKKANKD